MEYLNIPSAREIAERRSAQVVDAGVVFVTRHATVYAGVPEPCNGRPTLSDKALPTLVVTMEMLALVAEDLRTMVLKARRR